MLNVSAVRDDLAMKLHDRQYVEQPGRTVELAPVSFEAASDSLFGEVNEKYAEAELRWYDSMSLNVNDIPGGPPDMWQRCADNSGFINSNYGWCVHSQENGNQYKCVRDELRRDPASRRGLMIYTRPTMHTDQSTNGRQDFMCTNTVQYLVRDGSLVAHVSMRSNDAVWGYKNDRHWQGIVHAKLAKDLDVDVGPMYWTAGSLHVYERHFHLVHHYAATGETTIKLGEFKRQYGDVAW